tara:strand:- start:2335 stop:2979 length:645 start_codon:yes stop_codon:yes gene_type:complete
MRKYLILFLVLNTTSLYALFGGLGINFLQDQFKIPEKKNEIFAGTGLGFNTTAVENPIGVGVFVYLTAIPKIDLEGGYSFSFGEYKYSYAGQEEIPFAIAKGTWHASLQYPFFSPPTFRMYMGLGANGTQWISVVDVNTLTELNDKGIDLNNEDELLDALLQDVSGYHIELGARFKPPVIPYSFNFNARYNFVKDFYTDIDNYLTLSMGLAFAI